MPTMIDLICWRIRASFEAFIVPSDKFGAMSINRYIRQTTPKGEFVVQLFDSLEDAQTWLKGV